MEDGSLQALAGKRVQRAALLDDCAVRCQVRFTELSARTRCSQSLSGVAPPAAVTGLQRSPGGRQRPAARAGECFQEARSRGGALRTGVASEPGVWCTQYRARCAKAAGCGGSTQPRAAPAPPGLRCCCCYNYSSAAPPPPEPRLPLCCSCHHYCRRRCR